MSRTASGGWLMVGSALAHSRRRCRSVLYRRLSCPVSPFVVVAVGDGQRFAGRMLTSVLCCSARPYATPLLSVSVSPYGPSSYLRRVRTVTTVKMTGSGALVTPCFIAAVSGGVFKTAPLSSLIFSVSVPSAPVAVIVRRQLLRPSLWFICISAAAELFTS